MKKKIWIPLVASVTTLTPIMSIVACEKKDPQLPMVVDNDAVVIQIDKLSGDELIEKILGTLGTKMPKPIAELSPANETKYKELYENYLKNVNFTKNIIKLESIHGTVSLDFTDVLANMKELQRIARDIPYDQLDHDDTLKIGLKTEQVHGTEYTKIMLQANDTISLKNFMIMFDPKPEYFSEPTPEELANGEYVAGEKKGDIDEIVKNHPYINLLKAYHDVLYKKFVASDLYEKWVVGKEFTIAVNESEQDITGTYPKAAIQETTKPGEHYDVDGSIQKKNLFGKVVYTVPDTSNFEFAFFYSLVGLKN